MRVLITFLIMAYLTPAGAAERLRPISVATPLNEDQVTADCAIAFEQAFADKDEYERRPEINLLCLTSVNMKTRNEMMNLFMIQCRRASRLQTRLDVTALKNAFDDAYSMIFRRDCLDKAVAAYHIQQDQRRLSNQRNSSAAGPRSDSNYQWPRASSGGAIR